VRGILCTSLVVDTSCDVTDVCFLPPLFCEQKGLLAVCFF